MKIGQTGTSQASQIFTISPLVGTLPTNVKETYHNLSTTEKITTEMPMQIINQPNVTVIQNNTSNRESPSEKNGKTTAKSVKCNYHFGI